MSLPVNKPNTIRLAGPLHEVIGDIACGGTSITPGMIVEMFNNSGTKAWRPNSSAVNVPTMAVALEQGEQNLGVDDPYNSADLVKVWSPHNMSVFWGLVTSGNYTQGDLLQSNGDGTLKGATSSTAAAGVARFQALETVNVTVNTRMRVQVIGG